MTSNQRSLVLKALDAWNREYERKRRMKLMFLGIGIGFSIGIAYLGGVL
jgi:hypothetical protein